MISDPQIMAPVVDKAGRSTLTWSGWWTQVQAALNSFLGAFTIGKNNAITITNPAALQFGPGWTTWVAAGSCSGAMTIAGATVHVSNYLRVGPVIHFQLGLTVTLGGTADFNVIFGLPAAAIGATQTGYGTAFTTTNGVGPFASVWIMGTTVTLGFIGGAKWPIGVPIDLYIGGSYRVA